MAENNGDRAQQMITIEVPEFAFTINPDEEGNPLFIGLQIRGTSYQAMWFLCRPEPAEIERVARTFTRELTRMAVALKRQGRRLIVAEGVNSDVLRAERRPEGR